MKQLVVITIAGIAISLATGYALFAMKKTPLAKPSPIAPSTPSNTTSTKNLSDLIRVSSPRPGQHVTSPLRIQGTARGFWYFEASFPVRIEDSNGKVLGSGIAQAGSEWMTTDFVPFSVSIPFMKPATKTGMVVLEKDNPSGLSEHAATLRIPVFFTDSEKQESAKPQTVSEQPCFVGGCSSQICSEERGVISTCEYREEYACYKTATCERQSDGSCGWQKTPALEGCLGNARAKESDAVY